MTEAIRICLEQEFNSEEAAAAQAIPSGQLSLFQAHEPDSQVQ
jgi:hypothetical protein